MSLFSPAQDAALAGARVMPFAAIDMETPTRSVRLLVGSGFVTFGGSTYLSADEVFGVFSDIEEIADGVGSQAPALTVTLIPPKGGDIDAVSDESLQDSPFRIWLGVMDPITGLPIDDPILLLDGLLDVPTIKIDDNGNLKIDYDIGSVLDEFFLSNDAARLSDGFHQYLWPDELGCSFVTWVLHQIYFGTEAPDGVTL